jgi:nucleotide-binding universal stress UspA family protein
MSLPKNVLVPVDYSDNAGVALTAAFDLAEALGASIHILHVHTIPPLPDGLAVGVDVLTPIERAAQQALRDVCTPYRARPGFGSARTLLGDTVEIIVREARALPAALIVMGTHGPSGFKRFLLGSVSEAVLRAAPCPVLVVPSGPSA